MICRECKKEKILSKTLPYCPDCLRRDFKKLLPEIIEIHQKTRIDFHLPEKIPRNPNGIACGMCINNCRIIEGGTGYCGVRKNIGGKIIGPGEDWAYVDWYHDPLPTNCVADWVCEGSRDYGYKNLAVFYEACTFNCLFCQNWHYRQRKNRATVQELAGAADALTSCICYFGGDPTPFARHSIATSREILERKRYKKFRICWETNGSISPELMKEWIELALISNGCIKIDFKTFSEELNIALCGASNKNTKENIKLLAKNMFKREQPPLLVVSTLLIPGYIDEYEIREMAKFLSSINEHIPWSFLGFYPHFYFQDLPQTSRKEAQQALQIARNFRITNTHIGNIHLLID
uniref:Radical SAM protein n=1 Tax=candidate division WOR-3 bacterium TaxID=2052148 RepID=A0A7C4TAI5_UNCW3